MMSQRSETKNEIKSATNGGQSAFVLALGQEGRNRLTELLTKAVHSNNTMPDSEVAELAALNSQVMTYLRENYAEAVPNKTGVRWSGPRSHRNLGTQELPDLQDCFIGYRESQNLPPLPVGRLDVYVRNIQEFTKRRIFGNSEDL